MTVDIGRLLDDDIHTRLVTMCQFYIVANAAFGSSVGDKALHGLRIDSGHIAHIGIAVGITVGASNIVHKFITILNSHFDILHIL